MTQNLRMRKATINDLERIIDLLLEDELGQSREVKREILDQKYIDAFGRIDSDPNQYLTVTELLDDTEPQEIVGTCHLTIMPSLTFTGSTRIQIEAVRVSEKHRGQKIGEWMIEQAILYGKSCGASLMQLTTNKKRPRAKHFYEKIGFEDTHEGMKLYFR